MFDNSTITIVTDAILNPPVFTEQQNRELSALFGIDLDIEERLSSGDLAIKAIFGEMSFKKSSADIKRMLRKK